MIPVLIAPAYNRHDLLLRMLESIDEPVERTLVIQNNLRAPVPRSHGETVRLNMTVWEPPFESIGYGGAINFGITQTANAPWWLWVSNDVQFHPGHLATVAQRMEDADGQPRIVTGGFTWAAVNRPLLDIVGLVDDWSFFPIYFDDNDYRWRCLMAGVEWVEDWAAGSTHGQGDEPGSMTIRADERVRSANHRSFEENKRRYVEKWGGMPGNEVFTTPWDSGWPLWVTKPDIAGRALRVWR